MATLRLVEENYAGGGRAFRVYADFEGGWGFQSVDLKGNPYPEAARDFTELGRITVPEAELWTGDFLDWERVLGARRAELQAVADLHFRGTSARLFV